MNIVWKVKKNHNCSGWRVVRSEWGIDGVWRMMDNYEEAYRMAKAMGNGKEPEIER